MQPAPHGLNMSEGTHADPPRQYSGVARFFHWLTVVLLLVTIPIGLAMTYRGGELKIWDATTNTLYSSHKLLGVIILVIVLMRLGYRLVHGAPPDEPTLSGLQKLVAHIVHWTFYALLIVIPIIGWLGVSMFPALEVFGLFKLPALAAPDQATSKWLFELHETLGNVLLALIALHIVAALGHHFVLRDGVLRRMWPAKGTRDS